MSSVRHELEVEVCAGESGLVDIKHGHDILCCARSQRSAVGVPSQRRDGAHAHPHEPGVEFDMLQLVAVSSHHL